MKRMPRNGALEELVKLSQVRKQVAVSELARVTKRLDEIDARRSKIQAQHYGDLSPETAHQAGKWEEWKVQERARLNVEKSRWMVAHHNLRTKLGRASAEHDVLQHLSNSARKGEKVVRQRRQSYTS